MPRNYTKAIPGSTSLDTPVGLSSSYPVNGAHADFPAATPKYNSAEARNGFSNGLTVARIYLTGDRNFDSLPGPARNFKFGSYVGFLLQEVTERNNEKSQISPLNGDGYAAYFSGKEPVTYSFSGVLLNTRQDQWRSTFSYLYDNVFRGSKVAGLSRMVQVAYDDKVVTGSMLGLNQVVSATPDETYTRFTFELLVASVYDSWMKDESHFDEAWKAFIGDTSIFPVSTIDSKKASLKSYTRTATVKLPPKVAPKGAKKFVSTCDVKNLVVNNNGIFLRNPDSALTELPKNCDLVKERKILMDQRASLKKKIGTEKDPKKKAQLEEQEKALLPVFNNIDSALTGQSKPGGYGSGDRWEAGPNSAPQAPSAAVPQTPSLAPPADNQERENASMEEGQANLSSGAP